MSKYKPEEFIGKKLGKLLIKDVVIMPEKGKGKRFICICDCGTKFDTFIYGPLRGTATSCGCAYRTVKRDKNNNRIPHKRPIRHGLTEHPLRRVWRNMINRCYYKKDINYHNYGKRGITVCSQWKDDFLTFYKWAIKNNWQDKLEIDRKNTDGNYEPSNCRIISKIKNRRNKRNNVRILFKGKELCISELAEKLKLPYNVVYYKYRIKARQ